MIEGNSTVARPRGARAGRNWAAVWGGTVAVGVLLLVLGVFAIGSSVTASIVTIALLGSLLIAGGIAEMIGAFRLRDRGFAAPFLAGLLSAIVGGLVIWHPIAALATATLLISLEYIAVGLFRAITALLDRYAQWGWDVAYGVLALLVGGYLLATWPVSSLFILGLIVGVELILRGAAWIAGGFALRRAGDTERAIVLGGRAAT